MLELLQYHWPDTGDHGGAVGPAERPASSPASCACALVHFHPFHSEVLRPGSWQRELPASDLSRAASGFTRARWKPDPQASGAANPEPPSERGRTPKPFPVYRIPSERDVNRASPRISPSFMIRNHASPAAVWKREFNGCEKAKRKINSAQKQRTSTLTTRQTNAHLISGLYGQTFNPSPTKWRDFWD